MFGNKNKPTPKNCQLARIQVTDFGITNEVAIAKPFVYPTDRFGSVTDYKGKYYKERWSARQVVEDLARDPNFTYLASSASLVCRRALETGTKVEIISTQENQLNRKEVNSAIIKLGAQTLCQECPYFGMDESEAATRRSAVLAAEVDERQQQTILDEINLRASNSTHPENT